jgi:hypothetical protein
MSTFSEKARRHGQRHSPAVLVIVVYVVLAIAYVWYVPLGETPDEIGHFQFIRYIAEHGSLPVQQMRPSNEVGEGHQAPLYYLLGGVATAGVGASDVVTLRRNPDLTFTVDNVGNKNAMIHTLAETWPPTGYALAWRIARLLSVAIGVIAVVIAYAFALVAFRGDPALATGTLAVLALNPQWVFISAGIGTDSLAAATGSALLLITAAVLERRAWSASSALLFGLAAGAAVLTKLTLGVLVLVCTTACALALRYQPMLVLRRLLAGAGIGLAVAGWWLVRNTVLYGDPLALSADRAQNPILVGAGRVDLQLLRGLLLTLRDSYFARFGWMNVAPPIRVYDVLSVVLAVAALGLAYWLARRFTGRSDDNPAGAVLALAAGSTLAFLVALFVFAISKGPSGYQGRYLFPVAAAISVLLTAGLMQWVPARLRAIATATIVLVGAFACTYSLVGIILPAYPEPIPLVPPSRSVRIDYPLDAQFDGGIRLVGCDRSRQWTSGSEGTVLLYWRTTQRASNDYTVFVHLVTADGRLVAQHDGQPGGDRAPTSIWLPGETVIDRHVISLAGLPPSPYELRVGLYDRTTMTRLRVSGPDAGPSGDYVRVIVSVD